MSKKAAMLGVAVVLMATPVLARDRFDVDYGRNDNRHYHSSQRHRSGAWIDNHRGHVGASHGRHWGASHDHFSPRGQGGYHWGW